MTHPLSGIRVRTITKNSGDVPKACLGRTSPLKHVRAGIPPPVNQTLSRHDVIWQLLLFIAMAHAGCGLRLCTVTKNSDDILTQACLGTYLPNKFGHVPPSTCQSNPV